MQFKVIQGIDNNIFALTFMSVPRQMSTNDAQLMEKYGQPLIDVGGVFLSGTENEFTLPNKLLELRAGFPYVAYFDSRDPAFKDNTVTKVNGYRDAIIARLTAAANTLRTNVDHFSGEKIISIGDTTYINAGVIPNWVIGELPTDAINDVNTIFTTLKPIVEDFLAVYLNGLRTHPADITFLNSHQFKLADAPMTGDCIIIDYLTTT